uniref:Cyclin-like domain-containing protein n=1 Tax=Neobodo designis TaxID=312471 RepID=A0A7S1Q465_NEODS
MAIRESDDGLRLQSTVEHGTMTTQIPADFGNPGAYRLQDAPGQRDAEDHNRIYKGMVRKQLKPLADVKVLKGTVYSYKNRRIITRWIRDVCAAFKHKTTTFNMAVQFTDLFLFHHRESLPVNQCQLVALGSIWISAKFEETDHFVPSLQALVDVCDRAYTKDAIIDMEETLLAYVNFKVPHTTAINFMHLYLHCIPTIASRADGLKTLTVLPGGPLRQGGDGSTPSGDVDVLVVDRHAHQSTMHKIRGVGESTQLASLSSQVAAVLRIPSTTTLSLYLVLDTPVRLSRPVGDLTYADATRLASSVRGTPSSAPIIYARTASAPSCVFAERSGWMLLRTPNDDVLRVAEAALREALVNVEFLKVEQRVLGLAALAFAAATVSHDYIAAAATTAAVMREVIGADGVSHWEHFRSAVQLIGEKYAEMVQASGSVEGGASLPLPSGMSQRIDAFLAVVAPRTGATAVIHTTKHEPARRSDFDNL